VQLLGGAAEELDVDAGLALEGPEGLLAAVVRAAVVYDERVVRLARGGEQYAGGADDGQGQQERRPPPAEEIAAVQGRILRGCAEVGRGIPPATVGLG
jgi:hypothetical protein